MAAETTAVDDKTTETTKPKLSFIKELRELVSLKKNGDLTQEQFDKAKTILLREAVVVESAAWDQQANDSNRPLEKNKKYRKRSAADWVARMAKDLKAQEDDAGADNDPRKKAYLAIINEFTLAWTPNQNSKDLAGDVAVEKFQKAFEGFWETDGFVYYAGAQWGPIEGQYNVKSGQAAKLWSLHTNRGEYNFDFANAKIFAFDNILFMDFGFYPVQAKDGYAGKATGDTFTLRNKLAYYFNADGTKIQKMVCYSEAEADCKDIRKFYEAIDIVGAIEKDGLKPDGKGTPMTTYKGDTTGTWAPPLGKW